MSNKLSINDCRDLIDSFDYKIPNNIYKIRKLAKDILDKQLVKCYTLDNNKNDRLIKLKRIINRKQLVSRNKNHSPSKTRKQKAIYKRLKCTRSISPIKLFLS